MRKLFSLILVLLLAVSLVGQVKLGGTARVGGTVKTIVQVGGGGSDFVTDTFTQSGTGGGSLNSHVGEVGATWTQHPHTNYAGGPVVLDADTDDVYANGTEASYASGVPPSADYYVQATFVCYTTTSNIGLAIRMDTTADTMYSVRWTANQWQLREILSTTQTTLQANTTDQLLTAGTSKVVRITASGTTLTVTADGVTILGPITNTDISAAGRAGIRGVSGGGASSGVHIDNFSAR